NFYPTLRVSDVEKQISLRRIVEKRRRKVDDHFEIRWVAGECYRSRKRPGKNLGVVGANIVGERRAQSVRRFVRCRKIDLQLGSGSGEWNPRSMTTEGDPINQTAARIQSRELRGIEDLLIADWLRRKQRQKISSVALRGAPFIRHDQRAAENRHREDVAN